MKVDRTKVRRTVHITDYDRSETAGEYGIFQIFG
jgi:hypothetical protein